MLQATWANVREHAAGPPDYWGSRGRRFESGRPDAGQRPFGIFRMAFSDLVQQRSTATAHRSRLSPSRLRASRVALRGDLRVDLHRDRELGVPEDLHRDPGMHVQVDQQRGAGAPGVVHGDPPDAGRVAAAVPGAVEVARLDRRAVAGGEDQAGVVPGLAGVLPGCLLLAVAAAGARPAQMAGSGRVASGLPRSWSRGAAAGRGPAGAGRPTVSSPASRSTSSQVRPSTSPLRSPRTRTRTYAA